MESRKRQLPPQISIEITPPDSMPEVSTSYEDGPPLQRILKSKLATLQTPQLSDQQVPNRRRSHQPMMVHRRTGSEDLILSSPKPRWKEKRHSVSSLANAEAALLQAEAQTKYEQKKPGLLSGVKSLIQLAKSSSHSRVASNNLKPSDASKRRHRHIRQSSDSLVIDGFQYSKPLQEMSLLKRPAVRQYARGKILINNETSECQITLSCFLFEENVTEFEVQRMDLSEVGLSRIKHAESNDHLSRMDEQSTLSRIEKLFPNDDLELVSSSKKPRNRRKSAPSQILLKNFKKSSSSVSDQSRLSIANDYISRKFIYESPVRLTVGLQTQDRYLFLFNDVLFIAKQRSATSYKLKSRVLVSDMWLGDNMTEVCETGHSDAAFSFVIGWPTTNFVATFTSRELCERWREKLQSQIREEQAKEVEVIDVQVVYKGRDTDEVTVVPVGHEVEARVLLAQSLVEFNIKHENESEYQLWLVTSKEVEVYPLFGHERPFAIQLSHEREREGEEELKCQFVLREAKKQIKIDRKAPKSKKKKLVLSGLFRRSSGKLTASPRMIGNIFGRDLSEICTPDIPKPLMELLTNLYNVGPFTTEIFRKPANARKCNEMVEIMDSDNSHCWDQGCHNGILFASILKMFLKRLPDHLCCSELYQQWCEAINQDNSRQVPQLKKVFSQMPTANQTFLKYIICILYHIQLKSEDNLMNSSNLGISFGPSLLWTQSDLSADQEASSRIIPQLTTCLIDNINAILGQETIDIFGHPPIEPTDEDSNEIIHTVYNDSLESLSDNEPRHPIGLTQMSPSSCSRDSGLILSDPHEEQSDDPPRRTKMIKSKSCDSLSVSDAKRGDLVLQTQVSSDSLDCDDEYVDLGADFDRVALNPRGTSLLVYNQATESTPAAKERLRERLSSVAHRYNENSPPVVEQRRKTPVGYASTDSDFETLGTNPTDKYWSIDLHKSSTNSSIHLGSSSSDDAHEQVTHRHIAAPHFSESESGYTPRDLLKQFTRKKQQQESQKKQIQDIVREQIVDGKLHHSLSSAEVKSLSRPQPIAPKSRKNFNTHGVNRTNTFSGQSLSRLTSTDVGTALNRAEMLPIMPQQYRPNRPPPYREAVERKERMIQSGVTEIERIKQTVNSARAKQIYQQSVKMYQSQERTTPTPEPSPRRTSSTSDDSITSYYSIRSHQLTNNNNDDAIGVVKTSDKRIVIRRAPAKSASTSQVQSTTGMFYTPNCPSSPETEQRPSLSTSSLAASFYRPTQPPPYKETRRKISKPDLMDSLGAESLV